MKRILNKLVLGYVWRMDNRLLINNPLLWSAKLHYFIYAQLIIFILNALITGLQPVGFSHVPASEWILVYSSVVNGIVLIAWFASQTLLDSRFFHGIKKPFHDFKVVTLFFLVFFIGSASVLFPFWNLNRRTVNNLANPGRSAYVEQHKPSYVQSYYDPESYNTIDTTIAGRDSAGYKYYQLRKIYDSLNEPDRKNIFLSLGGSSYFPSLNDFKLYNKAEPPFFQFNVIKGSYLNGTISPHSGTLRVYYKDLVAEDSFQLQVLEKTFFTKSLRARFTNSETDTVITSIFYTDSTGTITISGDRDLHNALVEERINQRLIRESQGDRNNKTNAALFRERYSDSVRLMKDDKIILYYFYITGILSCLFIVIYGIIRFLGLLSFFTGLLFLCLIMGLWVFLGYLRVFTDFSNETLSYMSGIIFILIVPLLLLLQKNTRKQLLLLQLSMYVTWFLAWIFPLSMINHYNSVFALHEYAIVIASMFFYFLMSSFFISRLYKIYAKPKEV